MLKESIITLLAGVAGAIAVRLSGPLAPSVSTLAIESSVAPRGRWLHRATDDEGNLIWPDDPDEVPLWRLEREAWAAEVGARLPPYRTRREAEACLDGDDAPRPAVPRVVAPRIAEPDPAWPADVAAQRFLDWLRIEHGESEVAEFAAHELSMLYEEFCAQANVLPAAVDQMKKHFARLPGVLRDQRDERNEAGRRRRPYYWVITIDLPEALVDEEALEESAYVEPMRLAA